MIHASLLTATLLAQATPALTASPITQLTEAVVRYVMAPGAGLGILTMIYLKLVHPLLKNRAVRKGLRAALDADATQVEEPSRRPRESRLVTDTDLQRTAVSLQESIRDRKDDDREQWRMIEETQKEIRDLSVQVVRLAGAVETSNERLVGAISLLQQRLDAMFPPRPYPGYGNPPYPQQPRGPHA